VLSLDVIAQETRAIRPSPPTYPSVIIPNTELRTIRSEIVNQQFDISVLLPPAYMADSTAVYPVLYVTDANRAFPMVANIASVLAFPKTKFPEMIVVGIGYPIRDMADWAAWRTRDLTPTQDTATDNYWNTTLEKMSGRKYNVRTGGAPRFLEFIIKELIPFIESNYRVSRSDRGLAGYSYGGLFALYALLSFPETFQRYFVGSPSLGYDNEVLFKLEDEFAASGKRVRAKVFLSAGSLEDSSTVSLVKKMQERLTSRFAPDLQVSSYVFDGEDHRSCMAAAVMRAFRVLYGQ
jgi:predicted alpha/beta superfamily hydrolase